MSHWTININYMQYIIVSLFGTLFVSKLHNAAQRTIIILISNLFLHENSIVHIDASSSMPSNPTWNIWYFKIKNLEFTTHIHMANNKEGSCCLGDIEVSLSFGVDLDFMVVGVCVHCQVC